MNDDDVGGFNLNLSGNFVKILEGKLLEKLKKKFLLSWNIELKMMYWLLNVNHNKCLIKWLKNHATLFLTKRV